MQPDIIAFVRKVRELAQGEQWNRHEVDMLEEIEEILGYDVSEEQKHLEMKRVEKILRVHQNQSGPENTELAEYKEKERFLRNVQRQLSGCGSRCESVLERQIAAMEPEFEILKDELQEACNAGVNKRMMKNSQNFRTLILSKAKNFNSRLRAAAPFSQELIGEYDRCFESVKGQVINTPLEAFHMTEKEWYEKGGHNLDLLHSRLQTEAASVCLEETAFEGFAMQCGAGLEKIWKKQEQFTRLLYLIPLVLYLIKYIVDTYVIQKEGIQEKLVNMLLERMTQSGEATPERILGVIQTVFPLLQDKGAAGVSFNLVLAVLFFGWLYFLYVLIVKRICQNVLIRNLGGYAQQQLRGFVADKPWKLAAEASLKGLSQRIQNLYRKHYEFVNQKLVLTPLEEMPEKTNAAAMLLAEYQSWGG